MKPCIIDFAGNFIRYQIQQIQRLKPRFAIRLYELLRKHHPISTANAASVCTYLLDDLRAFWASPGSNTSGNFRVNVLECSQNELQALTGLAFDFEPNPARENGGQHPLYGDP